MMFLKAKRNGEIIVDKIEVANNKYHARLGLMFRRKMAENRGLLIPRCRRIHTRHMRFDLDVVTLSRDNKVVFIERGIKPFSLGQRVEDGYMVLELNSGIADKLGIALGDVITFE